MKYFKFIKFSITMLLTLVVVSICSIVTKNITSFILGSLSIYLILKICFYEKVIELEDEKNRKLRRIIHLLKMSSKPNEN